MNDYQLPSKNKMLVQIQVALAIADAEQMALIAAKCNPHEFTEALAIFYLGIMMTGDYTHIEAFGIALTNAALLYEVIIPDNEDSPPLDDVWMEWGKERGDDVT